MIIKKTEEPRPRNGQSASRWPITTAFVFTLMLGTGGMVCAFEKDEHQWITDGAVCAVREAGKAGAAAESPLRQALAVLASPETIATRGSFGEISAYADFVPSPRRLLDRSATELEERIDFRHVREHSSSETVGYAEVIRNPHHFGRQGLLEYAVWHEHALLLATKASLLRQSTLLATCSEPGVATGKRIDRSTPAIPPESLRLFLDALAYESYAVHFLQDFFAPEHLRARESERSLIATLQEHDRGNLEGMDFHLSRRWRGLRGEDAKADHHEAAILAGDCLHLGERGTKAAFKSLRSAEARGIIRLEGDARVYRADAYPRSVGKVYQPAEAVFLTLVTALSIEDILAAYEHPEKDWSQLTFPPTESPMADAKGFGIREKEGAAWLGIGHFGDPSSTAGSQPTPCAAKAFGSETGCTRETVLPPAADADPPPSVVFASDPAGSLLLARLPRTTFDVNLQRLNEGSLKIIGGEVFLDWWTYSPRENQTLEWSLGYTYVRGNSYDGHGPDAAVYYRLKNFYLWTSLSVGWRFMADSQGTSDSPRAALRVGFGPELVSVYAGVAIDSSIDDGQKDLDYAAFELGVKMFPPWQRMWAGLQGSMESWRRAKREVRTGSPR